MSENAQRSRRPFWLILALCIAPVAASYITFYFYTPAAQINYGELVGTRPLPVERLKLADQADFTLERLRGKWLLIMTGSGECAADCEQKLFTLRQLRLTQGKHMSRIERVWLITNSAPPPAEKKAAYDGVWVVRAAGSELLKALPAEISTDRYFYLADPLGNIVLRYPMDADPARVIKDLARLLKTSGIG